MYCSVPLSVSTAASARSEPLNPQSHTQTHKIATQTHKKRSQPGSLGLVWRFTVCLVQVPGPAGLRLPSHSPTSPLPPSLSTAVGTLQILTQSPNTDPDWTAEARTQTGGFNEAVCVWKVKMEVEEEKNHSKGKAGGGSEKKVKGWREGKKKRKDNLK